MKWLALCFLVIFYIPIDAFAGTTRVSESSDGLESYFHPSIHPSISDDGRIVVFVSKADNFVPDDQNGKYDVFLHDRSSGKTSRVSQGVNGEDANDWSGWSPPMVSGDGRFVVFESAASNLIVNDNNGEWDIFVFNVETGETERVSIANDGNEANGLSSSPFISTDGRYVTFFSWATNLVHEDDNGRVDVFLHDRSTGNTSRVNVANDGTEANEQSPGYWGWWNVAPVSDDGRIVAFNTPASNLVLGDDNGVEDVFVRDLQEQTTTRISFDGQGANPYTGSLITDMSDDGRYLLFFSDAIDEDGHTLFAHDRTKGETWPVVFGNDGLHSQQWVYDGCISGDGNYVAAFASSNTVFPWIDSSYNDLFVRQIDSGDTFRVTVAYDGGQAADGDIGRCSMSRDGRYVSFASSSDNLISNDHNRAADVFVSDNPAMFQINPGLNGSWYDPATSGQGFFIDVLPAKNMLFVGWLTFDEERPAASTEARLGDAGQRWLSAQGEYAGNQAILNIYSVNGGVFDAPEPSPEVEASGEMLFEFSSCRSGTVTYKIPSIDRGGVIPIKRVALDNANACESHAGEILTE